MKAYAPYLAIALACCAILYAQTTPRSVQIGQPAQFHEDLNMDGQPDVIHPAILQGRGSAPNHWYAIVFHTDPAGNFHTGIFYQPVVTSGPGLQVLP